MIFCTSVCLVLLIDMFTPDDLRQDLRFSIDEVTIERLFSYEGGRKYEVINVPVGMILRVFQGHLMSLYETAVYSYLQDNIAGKSRYQEYAEMHPADYQVSVERFQQLIAAMQENDYDIRKGAIIINEDNVVIDGQHRCCVILYKYGPFYRIPVLKCYSKKNHRFRHHVLIVCVKVKTFFRCIYELMRAKSISLKCR